MEKKDKRSSRRRPSTLLVICLKNRSTRRLETVYFCQFTPLLRNYFMMLYNTGGGSMKNQTDSCYLIRCWVLTKIEKTHAMNFIVRPIQ